MTLFQFLQQHYSTGGDTDGLTIRVDDQRATDKSASFCTVLVRLSQPESNDFQLILLQVPWDEHVEARVDELDGKWSGTSTSRTLTLSLTITSIGDIRKIAEAIRKVAGRGRRYSDRNWKWVTRRTADSLQLFADRLKDYRHLNRRRSASASARCSD
jgi:hypothetical protein